MTRPGEFDLNYPQLLFDENKIKLLEDFRGTKKHHQMQCLICNHVWSATPLSKRQTLKKYGVSGCPNCNISNKTESYIKIRQTNLDKLKNRGIEILDKEYDGRRHKLDEYTYTKILVRNNNCGHEFYCSPSNLLTRNVECGVCGPQKRVEPLTKWSKQNSERWKNTATEWQLYKHKVSSLTRANYTKYKKVINPKNLPRGVAGSDGAYHLDHIVPIRFCFEHKVPEEVCAHPTNLQLIGWRQNVGSRHHLKGSVPAVFNKYIATDTKVDHYVQIIKQSVFPNAHTYYSINGIIVSLYDEQTNHAILILPLHNMGDGKTAFTAMKQLVETKVNYSILFEDELQNLDLVCSKLQHYSKQNKVSKINARECSIKQISPADKGRFLNKHHTQGNDNSQIHLGAFFNDELVAVMTFASPRVALGQKTKKQTGMWELSRFATNVSYRIPGIASKLLSYFQKTVEWREIYSYADRRWSVGNLYQKLGFLLTTTNPPDYFYVIDGKRKHRWNYRKDILKTTLPNYNPIITEYQNMLNHGYHRVWDCGTLKFVIRKS